MHDDKTTRGAGRPRSAEKNDAILRAALDLLARQGYVRMTLDQVAAAAGVSKSTIHLRWKTKADLLTAALAAVRTADAPPPPAMCAPTSSTSCGTSPPPSRR